MWTLFVITLMPEINDAKVVRYAEFKTEQACLVEQKALEKEFKSGEFASCYRTDKIIKK